MKTIEFKFCNDDNANFYSWLPNGKTHSLSGRYVPAEVAERLLAAIKQVDDFFNDYHSENNVHLVVRSAIKQAEEG